MPITLKEFKEKHGQFKEEQKVVLNQTDKLLSQTLINSMYVKNLPLTNHLIQMSGAADYLISSTEMRYWDDNYTKKQFTDNVNKYIALAEMLKDEQNMKDFVKITKGDTNNPLFGSDGAWLANAFNILNETCDANIDIAAFTNNYRQCKNKLLHGEDYVEPEEEKRKTAFDKFTLIKKVDKEKLNEEVKEENKEDEKVHKTVMEQIEEDIFSRIPPKPIDQKSIDKSRAEEEAERLSADLYAKHWNNSIFRFGGSSREMDNVRYAAFSYLNFMKYPDDIRFQGKSEFELLKDIKYNSDTYRDLKRANGVGDTSAPDWKPKYRMGQLRYDAAGNMSDFAVRRMKQLVNEYAKENNVSRDEALAHFDPNNELNLFPKTEKKAEIKEEKKAPARVNFDEKLAEAQKNLREAKKGLGENEYPDPYKYYRDYAAIAAIYYMKTKESGKKDTSVANFEKAITHIDSLKDFLEYKKSKTSEFYNRATRDKGQDLWNGFCNFREQKRKIEGNVNNNGPKPELEKKAVLGNGN